MDRREFIKSLLAVPLVAACPGRTPDTGRVLLLDSVIAGFRYYRGEKVWRRLSVGEPLHMVREPENPHDKRAVEVYWRGEKLGYVPRADNAVIAQLMDRSVPLEAGISRLKEGDDPWERIGIKVEMAV